MTNQDRTHEVVQIFREMRRACSGAHTRDGQAEADAILMRAAVEAYRAFRGN